MVSTARIGIVIATLLAGATVVSAQQDVWQSSPPTQPGAAAAAPADAPAVAPPVVLPGYQVPSPDQALAPAGDYSSVLIDPPGQPRPGFFFDFQKAVVAVHFDDHLMGSVPVTATRTDVLRLPFARQDWAFAPGFVLGYRDPGFPAEYLVTYNYLATRGTSTLGGTQLRSRVDQSLLDFDYGQRTRLADGLDLRWFGGVRVAWIYLDSQANASPAAADLLGTAAQEHITNFTVGAGPHGGFDLFRKLPVSGLALYARGEAAGVWGSPHQTFSESFGPGQAAILGTSSAFAENQAAQMLWTLGGQLGLSWAPPRWPGKQLFVGYQILELWRAAMDSDSGSRGDLTEQGIFVRGEIVF